MGVKLEGKKRHLWEAALRSVEALARMAVFQPHQDGSRPFLAFGKCVQRFHSPCLLHQKGVRSSAVAA